MLKYQIESLACLVLYGLWMLSNAIFILRLAGRCRAWIFLPLRDIRLLFPLYSHDLWVCNVSVLFVALCCRPLFLFCLFV
jgi:hypothetical protein